MAFADIFAEGRDEEREGERGSWCGTGVPGLPMCLPARPWPWRGAQDRTGQDAEPCQVQLMVSLLRPKNSGCPVPSPPASAGTWRCPGPSWGAGCGRFPSHPAATHSTARTPAVVASRIPPLPAAGNCGHFRELGTCRGSCGVLTLGTCWWLHGLLVGPHVSLQGWVL